MAGEIAISSHGTICWEGIRLIPGVGLHAFVLDDRGKRLVVLVGQKKAVAIAVKNVSGRRRWSKLNEWLAASSVSSRDLAP